MTTRTWLEPPSTSRCPASQVSSGTWPEKAWAIAPPVSPEVATRRVRRLFSLLRYCSKSWLKTLAAISLKAWVGPWNNSKTEYGPTGFNGMGKVREFRVMRFRSFVGMSCTHFLSTRKPISGSDFPGNDLISFKERRGKELGM